MKHEEHQLSNLVDMEDPEAIIAEVKTMIGAAFPDFNFSRIDEAFTDINRLFHGAFPGYRACNTAYHDLKHTTDCFLAMARLIHGAVIDGRVFDQENVTLGLLSALFHDTGYIQSEDDTKGTGAKYTLMHIQRSIDFMSAYLKARPYPAHYRREGKNMLHCTGLTVKIREIHFSSQEMETLGKMLGTADLLGQMADRTYLEKLLFLYREFQEGGVPGCETEIAFLKKTEDFFNITQQRFITELGSVNRYMRSHFKGRWHLDADLYARAIHRHQDYLRRILQNHRDGHRGYLRRGGIVSQLMNRNSEHL